MKYQQVEDIANLYKSIYEEKEENLNENTLLDRSRSTVQDALRETKDSFDIVKGHLIDEGYADTEEAAVAIMANMSEEWKQSILDEGVSDFIKSVASRARQAGASGQGVSDLLRSVASRARQAGASMRNNNRTFRTGNLNLPTQNTRNPVRTGNLNLPTQNTRNPVPDRDEPLWGPGSKTPDGKPSPTRRKPVPDRDEPLWGPGSKTPDGKPSPTRRRPKPVPDRDEPLW